MRSVETRSLPSSGIMSKECHEITLQQGYVGSVICSLHSEEGVGGGAKKNLAYKALIHAKLFQNCPCEKDFKN